MDPAPQPDHSSRRDYDAGAIIAWFMKTFYILTAAIIFSAFNLSAGSPQLTARHYPFGLLAPPSIKLESTIIFTQDQLTYLKRCLSEGRIDFDRDDTIETGVYCLIAHILNLSGTVLEVGRHANASPAFGLVTGGVEKVVAIDFYENLPGSEKYESYVRRLSLEESQPNNSEIDMATRLKSLRFVKYTLDKLKIDLTGVKNKYEGSAFIYHRLFDFFKIETGMSGILEPPFQAIVFDHSLGDIVNDSRGSPKSKKELRVKLTDTLDKAFKILDKNGWVIIKTGSLALFPEDDPGVLLPILRAVGFRNIIKITGNRYRGIETSLILAQRLEKNENDIQDALSACKEGWEKFKKKWYQILGLSI